MRVRPSVAPMTERLAVDPASPDASPHAQVIARAAACLRRGGLVAFPTETVYGLGVHALDTAAVSRLFAAKGRPASDPLIVHVSTLHDVRPLVANLPAVAETLAKQFWPGPLTLVFEKSHAIPGEVTAGGPTVAIRVPAHPVARALLWAASIPIAAPSANLFSRPSPTRAEHVLEDLDGRIDMVIDGGPATVGVESTVLDLTTGTPTILRPGAVTLEMLQSALGEVVVARGRDLDAKFRGHSPGLLEKHYSPRAPLTLYEGRWEVTVERIVADARAARAHGQRVGVLLVGSAVPDSESADTRVITIGAHGDIARAAARLYSALRQLDASEADVILAQGIPEQGGLATALRDRLHRAAAGRIVHA